MEAVAEATPSVVFLDTCAIHCARLYLDTAKQHNLQLVPEDTGPVDARLRELAAGKTRTFENLKEGRKIVAYMRKQCDDGGQVEYAPIVYLEMACGLLRGKAIVNAAEEGIPHRMWSRMEEKEIRARLCAKEYKDVQTCTAGIEAQFMEAGIAVSETDSKTAYQAWAFAKEVLGRLFFDVGDCAVFASATVALADELVTTDSSLRDTIGWIRNPGQAPPDDVDYYTAVQAGLLDSLHDITGFPRDELAFPSAEKKW